MKKNESDMEGRLCQNGEPGYKITVTKRTPDKILVKRFACCFQT